MIYLRSTHGGGELVGCGLPPPFLLCAPALSAHICASCRLLVRRLIRDDGPSTCNTVNLILFHQFLLFNLDVMIGGLLMEGTVVAR